MKNVGGGKWVLELPLSPGKHSYKFVVDGNWVHDVNNPSTEPDGFGGVNSVIYVQTAPSPQREGKIKVASAPIVKNGEVTFTYQNPNATSVYLAGSFNNWSTTANPMIKNKYGVFVLKLRLPPGTYQYKYVVDGNWTPDPNNPNTAPDGFGGVNSVIEVK